MYFTLLLMNLALVTICLFACSQQLVVAGYKFCLIISDNHAPMYKNQVTCYWAGLQTRTSNYFRHNTYVYTVSCVGCYTLSTVH